MLRFRDISITNKLLIIMAIMAVLITTELVVLNYTIKIFSAVRSYVGGEGLWSKSQKNAAYYLLKYSYTHNETDYQEYHNFLKVPLSDHAARIALSSNPINYDAARKGFLGGRIHPDDIDGIIWLFSTFNQVPYIHKAIEVWTEADDLMEQFVKLGSELHQLISSHHATATEIDSELKQIDILNNKLTVVEDEFSYTLGQASRWLENIILKLIISIAIIVEFTGIFFTILTGMRISRDVNAMNDVAKNVANADYTKRVKVTSRDEIGQLALSFNTMIDELDTNLKYRIQLENRFKSILEAAPDAMVITNKDGYIVMVNAQAEKLFGYTREEIINKHVEKLVPERYRTKIFNHHSSYFTYSETRATLSGSDLFGLRKNGKEFPVEISLSPVETDEGILSLAAIRDVTEKKEIENMLLEKNMQLVNSDLAKDQFMSHVSHELRTPLSGIVTMTQLLLSTNLSEDQKEPLNIINESNEQLLAVINQILDFSKIESGNITVEQIKIPLRENIIKIIAAYSIKAEANNIKLNCDIHADVPDTIISDLVKIRQILSNLLDNAVKFTNQGSINLVVSSHVRDATTTEIIFEIIDTGIGIPAAILPKIFKQFSQGDSSMTRKYGGTGLGLAISKKLAEAMKGSITVRSDEGGTKFTFTLPVVNHSQINDDEKSHERVLEKIKASEHKIGRILLVEDNKLTQRTLSIILQKLGFIVVIANDGMEGLNELAQSNYDLVLMDCQMPNMDGCQATIAIRKSEEGTCKHLPIIGITAHVMDTQRQKCLDCGMDGYITKPFVIADLNKLINKFIYNHPSGEGE